MGQEERSEVNEEKPLKAEKITAYVPISTEHAIDAGLIDPPEGYVPWTPPKFTRRQRARRWLRNLPWNLRDRIGLWILPYDIPEE